MKCKYCQAVIEDDARFCPNCGRELLEGVRCIKCGEILEEGTTFCPYCGARQKDPSSSKPECQPHAKVPKKKKSLSLSNKMVLLFMALLLCFLIYLLFFYSPKGKTIRPELEEDDMAAKEEVIDTINQQNSAMEQQLLEDSLEKVVKAKSDSLSLMVDSLKKEKDKQAQKSSRAIKKNSRSVSSSSNSTNTSVQRKTIVSTASMNLGYANYKGSLRNGSPHDVNGRLIFKSHHLIDNRDPKGRIAEPGDYVIGEFVEGHLVQGIWYDANNQVKGSIIIGR